MNICEFMRLYLYDLPHLEIPLATGSRSGLTVDLPGEGNPEDEE